MCPTEMRRIVCEVLLVEHDPSNWSEYPNVCEEVNWLIQTCDWFKVYDIAEAIYATWTKQYDQDHAKEFEERLDQYFREYGIGWQMQNGWIVFRGSETFTDTTTQAARILANTTRNRAAREIHEALQDISRRPSPDITGAIQHSIGALECTARDVTGQPNGTLGKLLPKLNLPPPLDNAWKSFGGLRQSERAISAKVRPSPQKKPS
jgi:AbiJ N-terminal domain 4